MKFDDVSSLPADPMRDPHPVMIILRQLTDLLMIVPKELRDKYQKLMRSDSSEKEKGD